MTTTAPSPRAATGGLESGEIVVAGVQRILVAPVDTPMPASIATEPAAAWYDLGYTTEDGLAASFGKDTDDLMSSQSLDPVRKLVTGAPKTVTASLRQLNAETLSLALGGGEIEGDDDAWTFTPAPPSFIDERALIIEGEDGDTKLRIMYYRTMVSEAVEFSLVNTAGMVFPLTFAVLANAPDTFKVQGTAPASAPATTTTSLASVASTSSRAHRRQHPRRHRRGGGGARPLPGAQVGAAPVRAQVSASVQRDQPARPGDHVVPDEPRPLAEGRRHPRRLGRLGEHRDRGGRSGWERAKPYRPGPSAELVAEMAVALHVAPDALLRSDDEVLDALIALAERERTEDLWGREVQAVTAEMVHALWRLTVQVNAKKGTRPPAPLRIPRPWRGATPGRRKVSLAEFAAMAGGGGSEARQLRTGSPRSSPTGAPGPTGPAAEQG